MALGAGMIRRTFSALLLLLALGTPHAQERPALPCSDTDRTCAFSVLFSHSVRYLDSWAGNFRLPLEARVGAAPPELIEFLNLVSILNEKPNRPRAAAPDPAFANDVRLALAELPAQIRRLIAPRLAGVFIVEDINGTAWVDEILDANGVAVAGMIALSKSKLAAHTANSWASWKENTPFTPHPGFRLELQIASGAQNSRKNAIQYILLHEFGHLLAIGRNLHPSWNVEPKNLESVESYPYFLQTWSIAKEENRFRTRFDDNLFPQRPSIRYYDDQPKLPASEALAVYQNLEKTDLPTLYAAERPADDFAEAFVTYVHTILMKRPFLVSLYQDNVLTKTYKACWDEARCADKRRILEKFLGIRN